MEKLSERETLTTIGNGEERAERYNAASFENGSHEPINAGGH